VDGAGRVELTDSLKSISLTVTDGSVVDLAGKTFTVKRATVGGMKLSPGEYAAGSTLQIGERTLGDYLVDSGEGGKLVVSGVGFTLVVR
jgi:hypothetical protein